MQRRYSGPNAEAIARCLPGSSNRPDHDGRWRLRGYCHGHGDKGDSASLTVQDRQDGGITVHCFAGCQRREIIAALEQVTGLTVWNAWDSPGQGHRRVSDPQGIRAPERPEKGQNHGPTRRVDMLAIARSTWEKAQVIPADPEHPARRWLSARNLWRPGFPLPSSIRWLPAGEHYQGRGLHTGAGSLVALAAPPEAWTEAWPALPEAQAVQIIAVGRDGAPALDRPTENGGLGKRSYSSTASVIVLLGNPILSDAISPVRVAEGVADALALASRYAGPAVATLGTSGMADEEGGSLVGWLAASAAGTVIHADADAGGEHNARQLRRQLTAAAGGHVAAVLPAQGKDAAAAAAGIPFPALPTGWEAYAKTLAETTRWPRWEIARQAACILSEVPDDY